MMNFQVSSSGPGHVQAEASEQSPIHRALFCQEIAEAIFSHLSLHSEIFARKNKDHLREHHVKAEQRERRHALVAASRASTYISELALSVLWAQQLDFDHLFHLMPQYVSSWDCDDSPGLNGDPTDEQWATLQKYAALVRGVFYYSQSLEPAEVNTWKAILNRFGSIGSFLPRLTELGVLHVDPKGPVSEPFLLAPTLRHISIEFRTFGNPDPSRPGGTLLTTALEHIAVAAPSLASLNIDRGPNVQGISWTMPLFQSLRNLDIAPQLKIGASTLTSIAQLQHLRTLSLRITSDCTHLQGSLQSLTQLRLGGRPPHLQSFLTATAPPHLQHLSLSFLHDQSPEALTRCITTVLATVPRALSSLHLESSNAFTPALSSTMDVIQPALALRALTHFTFKFHPLPSLSDADIAAMLTAWPRLAALRIPNGRHPSAEPGDPAPPSTRPTPNVLLAIAARHPALRELVLPEVDLGATPPLEALLGMCAAAGGQAGHELRVLDMASGCGDRHACMRAAVMLDRLFPNMLLPSARGDLHGDEEKEKGWAAVVRLLGAMQAGRAHAESFERVWGEGGERDEGGSGRETSSGSGSEDEGEEQDEDGDEDDEGEDENEDDEGENGPVNEDKDAEMGVE